LRNGKVLFLTLYTLSLTGGIEKVCRNFLQVLDAFKTSRKIKNYRSLSLHDTIDINQHHTGFHGSKIRYGLSVLKQSFTADTIILSHIHLLIFAKLIRKWYPRKRVILFAHGIEVWKPLSKWKQAFLNEIEIWAVSQYTATQLQQYNQISQNNIKVLNNCLPKDYNTLPVDSHAVSQQYHLTKEQHIILTVCRVSSSEKYKGYDLVILAVKDLVKLYPNLKYFIVGKADEMEQARILKLIEDCNLQDHVFLTGYVPDHLIQEFYQVADIFAMPSKGEGFGLVFLEAIANRCRVLAGNSDGSRDALLNGEMGLLVDPEDGDAIYQGLLQLLKQPFSTEVLLESQVKVKKHFGFERYVEQVKELLFK